MKFDQLAADIEKKLINLEKSDLVSIRKGEEGLRKINNQLKEDVNTLKTKLINLELLCGEKQFFLPPQSSNEMVTQPIVKCKGKDLTIKTDKHLKIEMNEEDEINAKAKSEISAKVKHDQKVEIKDKVKHESSTDTLQGIVSSTTISTDENARISAKTQRFSAGSSSCAKVKVDQDVDVSRLDLRVGRIVEVSRHPDADSLYIEKVDLGESTLRTVVSGLVKHVTQESLQNSLGIFLCNLKPTKFRGITSEAMLMCASSTDGSLVQVLRINVPECHPGNKIFVDGYPNAPDEQLNPKKKIFEQIKPDLRINSDGVACYKGIPWKVNGYLNVKICPASLKDAQIC